MSIDEFLSSYLNGEPLHDSIVIGIAFTCFFTFYSVFFSACFSVFKKS